MEEIYKVYLQATGVATDTRLIEEGNLFFALSGPNFNGNTFADTALAKGAIAVVGDDDNYIIPYDHRYIKVESSLKALQLLANYHRKHFTTTKVIALTGSNGKTTTKELIFHVLNTRFKVACTQGNLNNHIGVPLTLLRANTDLDFLIVEMGANHQGEIHNLCQITQPDFGLITNIGKAHLEGFGGIEGVKKGKSEMYRHLALSGGTIFINMDDSVLLSLLPADSVCVPYHADAFELIDGTYISVKYKETIFNTHLKGSYNVPNIALAYHVGNYFGLSDEEIALGLDTFTPAANRSESITIGQMNVIKDAYNANPTSMKASIDSFVKSNHGKDIAIILGDMYELGEESEAEHQLMLEFVTSLPCKTFVIGKHFFRHKEQFKGIMFYESTADFLKSHQITNWKYNALLLKGSRGMKLESLLE